MPFTPDISENEILQRHPETLNKLLIDHTTHKNIFWATDDYAYKGEGYQFNDPITVDLITGDNGKLIQPRSIKSKEIQIGRTKDMAEVFTPSWVCNVQNNLVDEEWFGRKDMFNTTSDDGRSWQANPEKITFPEGKTWKDYVRATRLEITCGEAPYLVSRYDTTTGNAIPLMERIGLLDRKLRVVSENTETSGEWLRWARVAYQNTYGYEWQGDNLLLARENLLVTFIEYYRAKFGKDPLEKSLDFIAYIVSWNLWQMDGLKMVVPNSCDNVHETNIFGERTKRTCPACEKGEFHGHIGIPCMIRNWRKPKEQQKIQFSSLITNI